MRLRSLFALLLLTPSIASAATAPFTQSEPACCKPAGEVNPGPGPISFDELPFEDAIQIVRGGGSRHLAVFQDPGCVYSRRLEQELQKLDDVTIHVFILPVRSDRAEAEAIWCAPDQANTWLRVMIEDAALTPAEACDSPLDRLLAFAKSRGVRGTPTLVFENGDRIAGVLTAAQIEERLSKASVVRIARP